MEREEENELVGRAKSGDRAAQASLWAKYRSLAYSHANRFASINPGVDPDDLAQECFIALLRCADRFEPGRGNGFGTALYAYFEQAILDHLRTGGARPLPQESEWFGDNGVDEAGDRVADRDMVRECLAGLTKRERLALELRYGLLDGEDRTLGAVGLALGVSQEMARKIVEKALGTIRERFAERSEAA